MGFEKHVQCALLCTPAFLTLGLYVTMCGSLCASHHIIAYLCSARGRVCDNTKSTDTLTSFVQQCKSVLLPFSIHLQTAFWSERVYSHVMRLLNEYEVMLDGILLKPNM